MSEIIDALAFDIPEWVWPLLGVAAVVVVIWWLVSVVRRYRAKRRVEESIAAIAYDMLRNVLVPNGMGGEIHLNYLLLTERGLVVADLLERPGAIFGGDQMIEWTAIGRKRRYTFPNPQHGLYDRMAAVKLLAGDVPVEGRLIFTLRSEFPKGKPRYALRIDELDEDFPRVDKTRGNITAAFGAVWDNVKKHTAPNPLAR